MNNYYDIHAETFFESTVHADMSKHYEPFLKYLTKHATILDAGCGSGRDSLAFKKLGYQVIAIDASRSICDLARDYIQQEVIHMSFQEIDYTNQFEGIWACASLLHVPSIEIDIVINKFAQALKPTGVLFASFKYGDFEGERNGRYFHDLTEEKAETLFTTKELKIENMWITKDVRPDRVDELWLNILARRY